MPTKNWNDHFGSGITNHLDLVSFCDENSTPAYVKDSFITQDRNDHFWGGKVEATFSISLA